MERRASGVARRRVQDAALALLDGALCLLEELGDGHHRAARDEDLVTDDAPKGAAARGSTLGDATFKGGPPAPIAQGAIDVGVAPLAGEVADDEVVVVLRNDECSSRV